MPCAERAGSPPFLAVLVLLTSCAAGGAVEQGASFSITSPVEGALVGADQLGAVTVAGTCGGDTQGVTVGGAVNGSAPCVAGRWAVSLDCTAPPDGPVRLTVEEVREAGAARAPPLALTRTFVKDATPPAVAFIWPQPGSTAATVTPVAQATFAVRGSCTEEGRPVAFSGAASGSTPCTGGRWSAAVDLTAAAAGAVAITAAQTDAAGNGGAASLALEEARECSGAELDALEASILSALPAVDAALGERPDVPFSLAVRTEDGRELAYDHPGSTMTTRYHSASTSKWVSATVILSFMESATNQRSAHPLTLSSRPQDLLGAQVWPIPAADPLQGITLRQLLGFTSGLKVEPDCIDEREPSGGFAGCVTAIAQANAGNGEVPGAEFHYSSNHLQVAGLMAIEARNAALGVTTSSWQDLYREFQERTGLFGSSTYDLPSTVNPRLAGGMTWTGSEYLAFIEAVYRGQVLSRAPVPGETAPYAQQQLADALAGAAVASSPVLVGIGEDWHYGFGLWLECPAPTFDCQAGVDSWSSPGAYGAYPFMNRTGRFWGIIARQGRLGTFPNGKALYDGVAAQIYGWATRSCP